MNYDFDKVIDRTNTNSLKYDFAVDRGSFLASSGK